jgi:hypothetical protein
MRIALLLLLAVMLSPHARAQGGGGPPEGAKPQVDGGDQAHRTAEPKRRSAPALLKSRIALIEFEEAPLNQVLTELGRTLDTNVVVRWSRLTEAGVQRDTPITVRVRNLRVEQVLWLIMNEAGAGSVKLAYRADDDVLLISTADDLGPEMILRVYPVHDLIQRRLQNPLLFVGREHVFPVATGVAVAQGAVAQTVVTQSISSGTLISGGRGPGGLGLGDDVVQDEGPEYEGGDLMQELINVITATIEPESWEVNGGRGTIVPFRGMLVVRNSLDVHQKLGGPVTAP